MQEIEIKFSLTYNTVGIPTIYLTEEFEKLEYEGPYSAGTISRRLARIALVSVSVEILMAINVAGTAVVIILS